MNPENVLYEDNHLLALNKPVGLLTQPNGTDQDSLELLAKEWIKIKYQKPGEVFLGIVHRLDKPASGIVLCARTSKALSRLNCSIRNKQMHKTYLALVQGIPPSTSGFLEHYLVHDDYCASVSNRQDPRAKLALLNYQVIEHKNGKTLLEIELLTGRYHQIRAQLATLNCPIVGDRKYGSTVVVPNHGICLHHVRMEIPHPISKKPLIVYATPPNWG